MNRRRFRCKKDYKTSNTSNYSEPRMQYTKASERKNLRTSVPLQTQKITEAEIAISLAVTSNDPRGVKTKNPLPIKIRNPNVAKRLQNL